MEQHQTTAGKLADYAIELAASAGAEVELQTARLAGELADNAASLADVRRLAVEAQHEAARRGNTEAAHLFSEAVESGLLVDSMVDRMVMRGADAIADRMATEQAATDLVAAVGGSLPRAARYLLAERGNYEAATLHALSDDGRRFPWLLDNGALAELIEAGVQS